MPVCVPALLLVEGVGGGEKIGVKNVAVAAPCFQNGGLLFPQSWLAMDPGNLHPVQISSAKHFSTRKKILAHPDHLGKATHMPPPHSFGEGLLAAYLAPKLNLTH